MFGIHKTMKQYNEKRKDDIHGKLRFLLSDKELFW